MSSKNDTLELIVADERAKKDNTSLISFFASIMARITYEPPIIYQLGLIEIMKILQNTKDKSGNNMLNLLNQFIYNVNTADNQTEFIKLIEDPNKMVSLSQVANKINDRLYSLETAIYKQEGQKQLEIGDGIPRAAIEELENTPQKAGNKYMQIDKLSEQFKKEFKDDAENDIKTVYLQTDHDENVYITAFKSINTITVTFRGTASIKNALSDANAIPYQSCDLLGKNVNFVKNNQSGGFKNFFKGSIKIKELGGMIKIVDSTMNTLMYTLVYLSKTFLKQGPANPANVYTFGHSLGGGLTTIFAYEYIGAQQLLNKDEQQFLRPNITCISNAAPRVLNNSAREGFMNFIAKGKIKYLRQWTASDWVPVVPPETSGYYHPKAEGVTTTLKLAQTYKLTAPHKVDYDISLKGELGAKTGKSIPSIAAHCFQTYINYWPVIKRFSFGADKDTKTATAKHINQESSSTINIKFVTMGNDGLKSLVFKVSETSIAGKLKSKIDSSVINYEWFEKEVINKLKLSNEPLPLPEKSLENKDQLNAASKIVEKDLNNFATASCVLQETPAASKKGGKKSQKHRVNKKHKTKKHRVNKKRKTKKYRKYKKYIKSKKN